MNKINQRTNSIISILENEMHIFKAKWKICIIHVFKDPLVTYILLLLSELLPPGGGGLGGGWGGGWGGWRGGWT